MERLLFILIIIIVIVIIYIIFVLYNTSTSNSFLNGYWYADPVFCQRSEAENIVFLFNKNIATISVSQNGEYIENTISKYTTSFSYNPFGEYYNCTLSLNKKPRLFPKTMNLKVSVHKGNITLYRDKKIYANLYKNHVLSETIKYNNKK